MPFAADTSAGIFLIGSDTDEDIEIRFADR